MDYFVHRGLIIDETKFNGFSEFLVNKTVK